MGVHPMLRGSEPTLFTHGRSDELPWSSSRPALTPEPDDAPTIVGVVPTFGDTLPSFPRPVAIDKRRDRLMLAGAVALGLVTFTAMSVIGISKIMYQSPSRPPLVIGSQPTITEAPPSRFDQPPVAPPPLMVMPAQVQAPVPMRTRIKTPVKPAVSRTSVMPTTTGTTSVPRPVKPSIVFQPIAEEHEEPVRTTEPRPAPTSVTPTPTPTPEPTTSAPSSSPTPSTQDTSTH